MRSLCQVPSDVKFTRFPTTTALQRKLIHPPSRQTALGRTGRKAVASRYPVTVLFSFLSYQHWILKT